MFQTKIRKVGNSSVVTMSSEMLAALDVKDGDTVYVRSNQRFDHTTTKGTTVTSTRIVHLLRGRTLASVDNK